MRFFLILSLLLIFGGYFGGRELKKRLETSQVLPPIGAEFQPSPYPSRYRPFVLLIFSHNPGPFLQETLRSALTQHYPNYRIVYIDDASSDESLQLFEQIVLQEAGPVSVSVMQHTQSIGELPSLQEAVATCLDEEIIVPIRGGDQLAHRWVLDLLNRYYANGDLFATYGQFLTLPSYAPGGSRALQFSEKSPRFAPPLPYPMKSFYAGLFKKIDPHHLLTYAPDLSLAAPLFELADGHYTFTPEVLLLVQSELPRIENGEAAQSVLKGQTAYTPIHQYTHLERDGTPH
jgi:hypothetical protein